MKKAVSWALRQIGKRNAEMRIEVLEWLDNLEFSKLNKAGRWIVNDVRNELNKY